MSRIGANPEMRNYRLHTISESMFSLAIEWRPLGFGRGTHSFTIFFFLVLARNGLVVASRLGAGGDEVAILRFFILRFFLGFAR